MGREKRQPATLDQKDDLKFNDSFRVDRRPSQFSAVEGGNLASARWGMVCPLTMIGFKAGSQECGFVLC